MKTGIIVDGKAEAEALAPLLRALGGLGPFLAPVHADMQPKASPARIAQSARAQVEKLRARKARRIILLIDREDRHDCPPSLAAAIEQAMEALGIGQVRVVIKNRAFENWLIADPDGLAGLRNRFEITKAFRRHVAPNKADNVRDAPALLAGACRGELYHKGRDPARITKAMDPSAAAANSRSLRRFLRVLGHASYRDQSRRPAP